MAKTKVKKTKNETLTESQHTKALSNGLYTMLTEHYQDYFVFWRIVAKASGFRAGELITLSYSNDVPSYPMILRLFTELSTSISNKNDKSKDVLWLCSSKNSSFLLNAYENVLNNLDFSAKNNQDNIIFGCDNTNKIINCIKQLNPKVVFVDNFQMLDGTQTRNSEVLSKVCRQYNICIIVLNELNNIKTKQMPDITKVGSKSGLLDRSDKVYIMWNPQQGWYRQENGRKNSLHLIVCDLVKNRQSRLIREYLFYYPTDCTTEMPTSKEREKIEVKMNEDYYSGNDSIGELEDTISSAIHNLKQEIDSSKPFMVLKSGIII